MQAVGIWLLPSLTVLSIWLYNPVQATKTVPEVQSTTAIENVSLTAPSEHTETIEHMIEVEWGKDKEKAMKVARCESGLQPNATSKVSSARGIFQIIKSTWESNTNQPFDKAFDPSINIAVAKQIYDKRGWQPWKASYQCHKLS